MMVKRRKSKGSKKKRTLSPEHLAKLQAGRKRAQTVNKQMRMIEQSELGKARTSVESNTSKLLSSVRRKT